MALPRWVQGAGVIVGGVLIHLTLGTFYCLGNLNPYVASYIHRYGHPASFKKTDMTWTSSAGIIGQGAAMVFGGLLERRIGPRRTALLGGLTLSAGVLASRWSIVQYWSGFLLTYGLVFGIGMGFAYTPPWVCAGRWFPQSVGLVIGIVEAGFGGGAFIFNQVQTAYINRNGVKPMSSGPDKGYFTSPELLHRVPSVFILLASIYAAMQLVGCALLRNPPGEPVGANAAKGKDDPEAEKLLPAAKATGDEVSVSMHPIPTLAVSEAVRTSNFWLIWSMFALNGQAVVFFSSLWKFFAENSDPSVSDEDWALAGAVSSLFNAAGRILWGAAADRIGIKRALVAHCAISTALYATLYLVRSAGYTILFVYVCALFFCIGGNFSLFPTATSHAFGKVNLGANYGLIFTSQAVAGVVGGVLSSKLVVHEGSSTTYLPALIVVAGCTGAALVLSFVFAARGGQYLPHEPLAARALAKRATSTVN